jgi:transposase
VEGIGCAQAKRCGGACAAEPAWSPESCGSGAGKGVAEGEAGPGSSRVARGTGAYDRRGGQPYTDVAGGPGTGPASEKKSLHATERDTEENRRRREVFLDRLRSIAPEQLIFLDESGVSTQMTRRYGRAPRGVRVHETTPEGNWKILTILGAMSLRGMIATMMIEAATDAEIFLAYLDHVLCPALRPGDVVVMDNLSSHKVTGVRERIAAVGAELLYLPPYSPDLNPIEKAWAKLKQLLRTAKARSTQALEQAVTELLPAIRPQDAQAWFRIPFHAL